MTERGKRKRTPSLSTVAVLRALAGGATYGFDIMDATGLASGTVYPILARLERRRLVESSWEDPRLPQVRGRPARKYYRLTAAGRDVLEAETARYRELGGLRVEEA